MTALVSEMAMLADPWSSWRTAATSWRAWLKGETCQRNFAYRPGAEHHAPSLNIVNIRVSTILHRCHNREPLTSTAGRGPGASTRLRCPAPTPAWRAAWPGSAPWPAAPPTPSATPRTELTRSSAFGIEIYEWGSFFDDYEYQSNTINKQQHTS